MQFILNKLKELFKSSIHVISILKMVKYKRRNKQSKKIFLTPNEASKMLRDAAKSMGIELGEYNEAEHEKVMKILSKGTPLSKILLEMRGREC